MKNRRVLLKLSGESLKGENNIIDFNKSLRIANQIKNCAMKGVEIIVVIGGGNIWRGRSNTTMDSCTADKIGMLATTMNALALNDALIQLGQESCVKTAIEMQEIAEFYTRDTSLKQLDNQKVLILAAGIGCPYFSTDTAASLRALELKADIILKATNVDGVYTSDPKIDKNAKKLDEITYFEVLTNNLSIIDATSASLCMKNNINMLVFDLNQEGNLEKAILGENIGTIIKK